LPGGPEERDRDRRLCERAMAFMADNLSEPLRVSDIALQLGVSSRQLSRLFRRHRQESVSATLMRLRLERARASVLSQPDRALKDIAYACGFSRPAYFTACFRRRYGVAPALLRRQGGRGA